MSPKIIIALLVFIFIVIVSIFGYYGFRKQNPKEKTQEITKTDKENMQITAKRNNKNEADLKLIWSNATTGDEAKINSILLFYIPEGYAAFSHIDMKYHAKMLRFNEDGNYSYEGGIDSSENLEVFDTYNGDNAQTNATIPIKNNIAKKDGKKGIRIRFNTPGNYNLIAIRWAADHDLGTPNDSENAYTMNQMFYISRNMNLYAPEGMSSLRLEAVIRHLRDHA